MPIGFVYHPDFLKHNSGPAHPECASRLSNVLAYLKMSDIWSDLKRIEPEPCDVTWIEKVHPHEHVAFVRTTCERGEPFLDMDTGVCERSYEVARLAIGGILKACDAVAAGAVPAAFCAVRPPGHHAETAKSMGFCLFNNVAVAARYVQQQLGFARVLIVDWDVHHGNGTQEIFYGDGSVMYFSTHQFPHYPGTGADNETGVGPGVGATVNVPLRQGAGDDEYVAAFNDVLVPAADRFKPDFVLISAGFDGHYEDPLAGMQLTERGYATMTAIVRRVAEQHCAGRVVSMLEGGYQIHALCRSVYHHLVALGAEPQEN